MKGGSHGHKGDHHERHNAHSEHHHHAGHKGAVVHVHAKADGGKVMEKEPGKEHEDERTRSMVEEEERGEKRGGKVKGHEAKPRADRRARGGRMTPKSPFTGAGNTPKMSYESKLSHVDTGGMGDMPRPR